MAKKKAEGNNIGIFILLAIIAIPLIPCLIYGYALNKALKKLDSNIAGYRTAKLMRLLVLICALTGSLLTIVCIFTELDGAVAPEYISKFPSVIPIIGKPINPMLIPFVWCYVASLIPLAFFIVAYSKNRKQQRIENTFIDELASNLASGVGSTENVDSFKERIDRENISPEAVRIAYIHAMTDIVLEILATGVADITAISAAMLRLKAATIAVQILYDDRPVKDEIQKDLENTTAACQDVLNRYSSYLSQLAGEGLAPECPSGAVLKSGEICFYTEECSLYENTKSDVNVGIALNLNMFIPGSITSDPRLYLGKRIPYEKLKFMDIGNLIITSKRLIFVSTSVTRSFKLSDIISISAGTTGVQIGREDKVRPEIFGFTDLFHTQLFITILKDVIQRVSN